MTLQLLTSTFFILTSIYGGPADLTVKGLVENTSDVPAIIESENEIKILTIKDLEEKAKEYFKDEPILVDIAKCESSFRHYDKDGTVLKGRVNKSDVGLMQINEYYHGKTASILGYDLRLVEGNMAYAKYLYEREGGAPWKSSSNCWNQVAEDSDYNDELAINK